jgi:16S rRNA (adenine1518-N6/adenine1519-N6)-dimethyltransferase
MFRARKRFGQHFLHEHAVITKIVNAINPHSADHMLEIGPGLGALTHYLLPRLTCLSVVELDKDLIAILKKKYAQLGELIIYQADALKFDLPSLDAGKWRIVGNLPYNISTPLLFHLLKQIYLIKDMHFMLQQEVVERIIAQPGGAHYGRLSVMLQYYCKVEKLFIVKPGAFQPPPQVNSAFIRLRPYQIPVYRANDVILFAGIVRLAFNQRRKMLKNNLNALITQTELESLTIDPKSRPEQIAVKDYVRISNFLSSKTIEQLD